MLTIELFCRDRICTTLRRTKSYSVTP